MIERNNNSSLEEVGLGFEGRIFGEEALKQLAKSDSADDELLLEEKLDFVDVVVGEMLLLLAVDIFVDTLVVDDIE